MNLLKMHWESIQGADGKKRLNMLLEFRIANVLSCPAESQLTQGARTSLVQ
jgi:hypothetical protein